MSHRDIIDQWPSLTVFASDIGVPYGTAKAMRRRGRLPVDYWAPAVSAADRRNIDGVSLERLADAIAATPTQEGESR